MSRADRAIARARWILLHRRRSPFSHGVDASGRVVEPYFRTGPTRYEGGTGDYAVPDAIVELLASAGLRIEFVHEHPFCDWPALAGMARGDDSYYRLPDGPRIPHMYSLKATP